MTVNNQFSINLKEGQAGENAIATWLKNKGFDVLPVYEKIIDTGKGPQLFTRDNESLVAPDLLCFKDGVPMFVEAKRKSGFTWHRKTKRWVTGIDLRHYLEYIKVLNSTKVPIYLCFVQEGRKTKDDQYSNYQQPSGLFVNDLSKLTQMENHRSDKWGVSGMVYWSDRSLIKKANLSDIYKYIKTHQK